MGDFPTYPIYRAKAMFTRELMSYDIASKWDKTERLAGLPRHRIRDMTTWDGWMYRDDPGEQKVLENLEQAWHKYVTDPASQRSPDFVPRDPQGVSLSVELVECEEWCLTWFCHQTFDIGQTDEEALESFQRFLDRKGVRMNYGGDSYYTSPRDGEYCAMGAEDRWRWRGENDDSPPPCRCAGCKKAGMIRINH